MVVFLTTDLLHVAFTDLPDLKFRNGREVIRIEFSQERNNSIYYSE